MTMKKVSKALLASAAFVLSTAAAAADKVVVHINDGTDKAPVVLNNVKNLLNAMPADTKVVVVGHGPGIDFMIDGAKDKNGNPFDATMQSLKARGVEFRACMNTFTSRKIDPKTLSPEAVIIPSGVAEIAKLQAKEGVVYLKP
jgi:intracellular sulfur oxidation DsrE/DsrF family protein